MHEEEAVAIVGAGLSGVIAARDLARAGARVAIYEKSRGAGGRMATRRGDAGSFDHGAQYMRAEGADFAAEVACWQTQGLAARWEVEGGVHVGLPGMNAPVKHLAAGLPLETGFAVAAIDGMPGRWHLRAADGGSRGPFAAVLVSAPAPQAHALLAPCETPIAAPIAEADYAPSLSLMLRYAPGTVVPRFDAAARFDHPAIAWIADDGAKPGRSGAGERFVVHATSAFSRTHLERDPGEIAASLAEEAGRLAGARAEPLAAVAHRWRYAFVTRPAGSPCFWDGERRLGACGDWCLGPRIEAAFDSGRALAAAAARDLVPGGGR